MNFEQPNQNKEQPESAENKNLQSLINSKNMSNKENTRNRAETLLEKVKILHQAFEISGEKEPEVEAEDLEAKFQRMLKTIPDEIIRNRVAKIIDVLKRETVSRGGMTEIVEDSVHLNLEHYFDSREYVKLARKELSKYRLSQIIDTIADKETISTDDLKKVVRVAFDLNGLKAMNDLGGHKQGDEGLRMFSTVLREGKTTKWLEGKGFEVLPSSEGGDEFGLVISGLENNTAISDEDLKEISQKYREEVYALNAKSLVDLNDAGVRVNLLKSGFSKKRITELMASGFEFKLSSSVDASRLDEALNQLDIAPNEKYQNMVRAIVGKMFDIADKRAIADKEAFKGGLEHSSSSNERALFDMYSRLDKNSIKVRLRLSDAIDIMVERLGLSYAEVEKMLSAKEGDRDAAIQKDIDEELAQTV